MCIYGGVSAEAAEAAKAAKAAEAAGLFMVCSRFAVFKMHHFCEVSII